MHKKFLRFLVAALALSLCLPSAGAVNTNRDGDVIVRVGLASSSSHVPQGEMESANLENNNSAIYSELGVQSFPKYVAAYISRLVLKLISFLVTFLLAIIIVKALMFAVNIIGELPVLGLVNHIAGGVLGLVLAIVIVWVGFLVMTLAYSTDAGAACFEMMEKSRILRFLYETNPLLLRLLGF